MDDYRGIISCNFCQQSVHLRGGFSDFRVSPNLRSMAAFVASMLLALMVVLSVPKIKIEQESDELKPSRCLIKSILLVSILNGTGKYYLKNDWIWPNHGAKSFWSLLRPQPMKLHR